MILNRSSQDEESQMEPVDMGSVESVRMLIHWESQCDNHPLKSTARPKWSNGYDSSLHRQPNEKVNRHMKEGFISTNNLSDDERSPRYQFEEGPGGLR